MINKFPFGKSGPAVACLGYGAMGLSGTYGASEDAQGIATIRHALDLGMNMIDTSDAYGNGHNEMLIASAIKGRRDDAFIATKFGIIVDEKERSTDFHTGWGFTLKLNGTPEYAARAVDASLKRLQVDVIDLWYVHYPDPTTPIEVTVGAMADAVKAGKVRHLGLSNVTAEQVRRAHRVHPVSAVQYEYSLWRREVETELLPTLRELGIALVPWSPLGNGFLTGTVAAAGAIGADDMRQAIPRFAGNNLQANVDRFAPFMAIAAELKVTPAQLALAWLLHQGEDVFPIPGTRQAARVDENAHAATISIDAATLHRIDLMARPGLAAGGTLL